MPERKNGQQKKVRDPGGLGRALVNKKTREARKALDPSQFIASTSHGANSVTQETDIDEFINTAQLAETNFMTDRTLSTRVIAGPGINPHTNNPYLLTPQQERQVLAKQEQNRGDLQVPRRPPWTRNMKAIELDRRERAAFLEWRRGLANLQDNKDMLLTPFERNIEVWRQLWRTIERSDVVIQIVDARSPLTFRSEDLEMYVAESNKNNLLLINKADYLTYEQRQAWVRYFQSENVDIAFYSAKASQEFEQQKQDELAQDDPARIISVHDLEDLFLKHAPQDKEKVTIGLVGYPNVGKSSTINSLMGAKKVSVSSTPGKTKHLQTMDLSSRVMLCDCPGLVFPQFASTKADLVCDGVLPIDQLRESIGPVSLVTQRIPVRIFTLLYGIKFPEADANEDSNADEIKILNNHNINAHELLGTYAASRGFFASNQGGPDKSRAARIILKDYVNGKLLYCKPPPGVDGAAFNMPTHQQQFNLLKSTATQRPQQVSQAVSVNAKKMTPEAMEIDEDFFSAPKPKGYSYNSQMRSPLVPTSTRVNDDGTISKVDPRQAFLMSLQAEAASSGGKKNHRKAARQKKRNNYD